MRRLSVHFQAFALSLVTPTLVLAQAPADTPPAEPVPAAPATTADPLPSPPAPPAKPVPEKAVASPALPPVEQKVQLKFAPPMHPRWLARPTPIWWGKSFDVPKIPVERWYGWQTIASVTAADILSLVSFLGARSDARFAGVVFGVGAHLLSGPVVHWAHGHVGRGFGVLELNLAFAAAGLVSTVIVPWPLHPVPAVLGYLAGPILDITLFSTEIVKERTSSSGYSVGLVPMIDSTRRGIILAGQF